MTLQRHDYGGGGVGGKGGGALLQRLDSGRGRGRSEGLYTKLITKSVVHRIFLKIKKRALTIEEGCWVKYRVVSTFMTFNSTRLCDLN